MHDSLGVEAAESLVEMLRQLAEDQEQRRAEQKEHLLEVLDERFLRRLAEAEERLHQEIADTRAGLHKETGAVRKEITSQTKWILVVMVAATVLIPVWQRGMAALIP